MAGKQEFESYLVGIAKKYITEHPESNIKIKKEINLPIKGCEYCKGKPIFEIPFSDTNIKVVADKLSVNCSCGYGVDIQIDFCPKCGGKLIQ